MFVVIQVKKQMQVMTDGQAELLRLVRGLATQSSCSSECTDIEDLVPEPYTRVSQLKELCTKVESDEDFKHKLVNSV